MPVRKRRLLVADDDRQFLKLMKLTLQFENYDIILSSDGQQTIELFEEEPPDMLILDINLPRMNGFEVCKRVREFSAVPIIFVTAREQVHDRIECFNLGADDFVMKPVDTQELLARVRAVLRRSEVVPGESTSNLTVGELTIHYARRQVCMAGHEISLTPIEYNLLSYLAKHVGRVLTHYQLLDSIWGGEYINEQQLLRVNINRLRHKLEPNFTHPSYILTKAGIGYMLAAHPQRLDSQSEAEAQPREESSTQALPILCNACRKIVQRIENRAGRLIPTETRGSKRAL